MVITTTLTTAEMNAVIALHTGMKPDTVKFTITQDSEGVHATVEGEPDPDGNHLPYRIASYQPITESEEHQSVEEQIANMKKMMSSMADVVAPLPSILKVSNNGPEE